MSNLTIDAAFRSSTPNECYMFVGENYVVLNYAPCSGDIKKNIINGPIKTVVGFPMFAGKLFQDKIHCAFDTEDNDVFIFSGNQCAKIQYVPHSAEATLLIAPIPISQMFPCIYSFYFANGIDAAIKSTGNEVYLFKGGWYARINYRTRQLMSENYIGKGFSSLYGTVFESGIEAAFASHVQNEAYIFKKEYYARINFAPGTADGDFIVGGKIRKISTDWPALKNILHF